MTELRQCRWHDPYPQLSFWLQCLEILPKRHQFVVSKNLHQYALKRLGGLKTRSEKDFSDRSLENRWYDRLYPLVDSVALLKQAPHPLRQQATFFLDRCLLEADEETKTAAIIDMPKLLTTSEPTLDPATEALQSQVDDIQDDWMDEFLSNHIPLKAVAS